MNKITKVALIGKGFKDDAMIEALIKVCKATPNEETAIEMILGVYEEPKISEFSLCAKNAKFKEFNPLAESYRTVAYSYDREIDKYLSYNPAVFESEELAKEAWENLTDKSKWIDFREDNCKGFYVKTGEFKKSESATSLFEWEEKAIDTDKVNEF